MIRHDGKPILNIIGEQVTLGPLRKDLLPLYQRWINDLSISHNVGRVSPMTFEQQIEWYDSGFASDRTVTFTIYDRASLKPIGNTSLNDIDYRHRHAEFGILIGEREYRGRGRGTETTRLMLDYAFTALGLHNIMLRVLEFNPAARRAYEKAGFRELGQRKQSHYSHGRMWDDIYMQCLATEFESPVLERVFAPDEPR